MTKKLKDKSADGKNTGNGLRNNYTQYYTASDVTVTLLYNDTPVVLDLVAGIGFNHMVNTTPFYGLGYTDPIFFNRGNSIGHGQIDIAFKSDLYLRNIVNYLTDVVGNKSALAAEVTTLLVKIQKGKATHDDHIRLSVLQKNMAEQDAVGMITNSIMSLLTDNLDIEIKFNNSNSEHTELSKIIVLYGCKFHNDTIQAHTSDQGVIYETYNFMFKNKRTRY